MKNTVLTRNFICSFLTILFFVLLISGCDNRMNDIEKLKKDDVINTENFTASSITLESEDTFNYNYEKIFSDELEFGNDKITLEIWNNKKLCTNGIIKIDNQEIPINPKSESAILGYSHTEANVFDLTNNGKEEIILVVSGGASGVVQSVQVFENVNDKWREIDMPSGIYDENGKSPEFIRKKLKELNTELAPMIIYNQYRQVSFETGKIFIDYLLWTDTNSGSVDIGVIRKEMIYSSEEKNFILGDTLFIPAENP